MCKEPRDCSSTHPKEATGTPKTPGFLPGSGTVFFKNDLTEFLIILRKLIQLVVEISRQQQQSLSPKEFVDCGRKWESDER